MRRLPLVAAVAGFTASALLHLLSFTPWGAEAGGRAVWVLGVGAFLLALTILARLRRAEGVGQGRWGRLALLDWRAMIAAVPPGLRFMVVGTAVYAWMNFVLCVMIEVPAPARTAITLRMASGHLIFFFLVPLIFFRFVEPGLAAARSGHEGPHP
jgi:hypothetical protein